MRFQRRTWIALVVVIILIALPVIFLPVTLDVIRTNFPVRIDPVSEQQRPTAEYLLDNPNRNIAVRPFPGTSISPGQLHVEFSVGIEHMMEELDIEEDTLRQFIIDTAQLSINGQPIEFLGASELPPLSLTEEFWHTNFFYIVEVIEGLYILEFSFETPDGERYAYSWAYRVEEQTE